ncbi:MAG: hypothetical protein QOE68_2024 [Thermoanaerobaculia bacterium]|nr:hypothetical protein [Thermoanaerobaculia bacterium]
MIEISTDKSRIDVDAVHDFLSNHAYWAKGIPRNVVERAIANSIVFAAYDDERLVAFARVITDCAVFAYLADVFVVPSHRGRGIGKQLMSAIRAYPLLQGLRRWLLVTRDAHALYRQFGFRELAKPERHMEAVVIDPYGTFSR